MKMIVTTALLVFSTTFVGLGLEHKSEHPEDWKSPDTLAATVYAIVSGPAGRERDWDRYRVLCLKEARFTAIDATRTEPKMLKFGVDDYNLPGSTKRQ